MLKDLEMRGSTRFLNQKKPLIVISDVKTTFFDFLPVELTNPSDFSTRFFWFWPFRNWSLIWFWPGAISRYFFFGESKKYKKVFSFFLLQRRLHVFTSKFFCCSYNFRREKKLSYFFAKKCFNFFTLNNELNSKFKFKEQLGCLILREETFSMFIFKELFSLTRPKRKAFFFFDLITGTF